jgi:hypothetical protein
MSDEINNGQATPETPVTEAPATEETWQFGQTPQQQPTYEAAPQPTYEAAPQYDQAPPQQPTYEAAPQYSQAPPQQPSYQAAPQYGQYQQPQPTPTKAIVSLVLGIVSIVFSWTFFIGIIGGIVAIVLAKQANREYKTGVGTGGFVTGIIGLVIGAIVLIVSVLFVGAIASTAMLYDW